MVKQYTYITRSKNKKPKRKIFDFPYTWLTEDKSIGKSHRAYKHAYKTWHGSEKFSYESTMGTRPPNQRLLWFTDDQSSTTTGNPRKWLILKESNILNSGYGVFAARPFKVGDVITKYIGVVAQLETKSGKQKQARWAKEGSAEFDYRLALEKDGKKYLIAANSTQEYLFGHFIQHSDEPNCAVERRTGLIRAIKSITRGTELTLQYNKDMQGWTFKKK